MARTRRSFLRFLGGLALAPVAVACKPSAPGQPQPVKRAGISKVAEMATTGEHTFTAEELRDFVRASRERELERIANPPLVVDEYGISMARQLRADMDDLIIRGWFPQARYGNGSIDVSVNGRRVQRWS